MNNACEIMLTRWAEPFSVAASFIRPQNNEGFFEEAWSCLLLNHAHDSICGCSITRVHEDNKYRFDQVKDLAQELIDQSFSEIADAVNTGLTGKGSNIVLFNASQEDFEGIVEAELEFPEGSQGNFRIVDQKGQEIPYQITEVRRGLKGVFRKGDIPDFQTRDFFRVVFNAFIPAVGYSVYGYEEFRNILPERGDYTYKKFYPPVRYPGSMRTGHRTWANEYISLSVNSNGTIDVVNLKTGTVFKELLIFEDSADNGEGYNYKSPRCNSRYLSTNCRTEFSVEQDGPILVKLKLVHYLNLPAKMNEDGISRSSESKELRIVTYIEMKKGSSMVEFKTVVDNNIRDHRLRVLFPNYLDTDRFYATSPFFLQERKIQKDDCSRYAEEETGVYPNQGIVLLRDEKDCLALYNRGLYEIEVFEDPSHTLALTLSRSFRNEVGRDMGELSFMQMKMCFEYCLDFRSSEISNGNIVISGERWRTGIRSLCTDSHQGTLPGNESFLRLNAENAVLSAFKIGKNGMIIIRIFNCAGESTEGFIELYKAPQHVYYLNLNDEIIE